MELTLDLIKRRSFHFDLKCITNLDLSHAKLENVKKLKSCVNLIALNLSFNEISSLEDFPEILHLQYLNVSNNKLNEIDTIIPFPVLEELILSNNQITSIDFNKLSEKVKTLNILLMQLLYNPIAEDSKSLFTTVQSSFKGLLTFNGKIISFYESPIMEDTVSNECTIINQDGLDDEDIYNTNAEHELSNQIIIFNSFLSQQSERLAKLLKECEQMLHEETDVFLENLV